MMCDMCARESGLVKGEPKWCSSYGKGRTKPGTCTVKDVVEGVTVGCFPDLYKALSGNMPDQVITL